MAFLDRINFAFAAISMNKELGLTAATFGLAGTIMYTGYFAFEVPSNILLVKFGARRWISRIMITWGIASAATAAVSSPMGVYIVRFIVGVAEAGFLPGVLLYVTYWVPTKRRARATSLFMIAQPIAIGFGSLLSGLIMSHTDQTLGLSGWQWMFILEGVPAVILGLFALSYLPDGPRSAKWLTQVEKDSVIVALEAEPSGIPGKVGFAEFATLPFIMIGVANFALITGLNALATWSPLIIQEVVGKNAEFLKIGLLSAIPGVLAAIAMPLLAASSDRKSERAWHYGISAIIAVLGWLLVASSMSISGRVSGLVLATAFGFGSMPILWSIPAAILTPKARPIGLAILSAIGILGSVTSPSVVGVLRDITGSFNAGIYYAAALTALSAVLFVPVARSVAKAGTGKQS